MRSTTRTNILAVTFVVALCHASFATADAPKTYGSPITLKDPISLTDAAKTAATYKEREILVNAEIKQVCKEKGCWMAITDGTSEMRVTFKDYAFFVPKNIAGKKVRAQGQLVEKEESVSVQKHYLKDAGASAETIASVKSPKKTVSFIASGVEVTH